MNQTEKTLSRNIILALAILGLGILGYLGRNNIAVVIAAGLGEIALGAFWLIRIGNYLEPVMHFHEIELYKKRSLRHHAWDEHQAAQLPE